MSTRKADARFKILSATITTAITLIKLATAHGFDRAAAEQAHRRARHVFEMAATVLQDQRWAAVEYSALKSALADLADALDSWWVEHR